MLKSYDRVVLDNIGLEANVVQKLDIEFSMIK